MKIHISIFSVSLFLAIGIFVILNQVSAQDGVYDSETGGVPAPGGAVVEDSAPAGTTVAEDAFNPLWLLPLIAIPILVYILWPKKKERESMEIDGDFVGAKGGRAEKKMMKPKESTKED